jgi:hypothetical protein
MSQYIYDNVALQYCRTLSLEMVTERDPSGTDVMWTKYTIRVRGFVCASPGQSPNQGATNPATGRVDSAWVLNQLKSALTSPRRSLLYSLGTNVFVNIGAGLGAVIDAKLGPDPLPTTVREITSGMFMVETGCVVRVVECATQLDSSGSPCAPNPVLSLRWTQSESFDDNWYSHLHTSGRLIVRSDLLQSADNFRPLATPPIVSDYIRTSAKYTLSEDGLQLAFQFEDVEVDRLPPYPATKASGKYIVECPMGVQRIGQISIHLEGQKGTNRRDLLVRAMAMCYSKLQADGNFGPRNRAGVRAPLIKRVSVVEDLFSPIVDVSMQAMMTPILGRGGAAAALVGALAVVARRAIGGPPPPAIMPSVGLDTFGLGSGKKGIAPPERKRLAGLLTAMFSDPCACMVSEGVLTTDLNVGGFSFGSNLNTPGGNPAIGPGILRAGG